MTTEGWIGVMWNAVDSVGINQEPIRGNSPSSAVFFLAWVLFGS